jgi:hypothetical protein
MFLKIHILFNRRRSVIELSDQLQNTRNKMRSDVNRDHVLL